MPLLVNKLTGTGVAAVWPGIRWAAALLTTRVPSTGEQAGTGAVVGSWAVVDPLATPAWDEWVRAWPQAGVFHTAAWMSVLAGTYGFKSLALVRPATDGRRALLPLMECASPWRGRRGVALPFSDHLEILAASPAEQQELLEAAITLGRIRGWRYVEGRSGGEDGGAAAGREAVRFLRHVVRLDQEEAALFAGLEGSVRQAIRKAAREGVEVRRETSWDAVAAFYELHGQTRRTHGLPPQPVRFFRHLHTELIARGAGAVFCAYRQGRPLAAAIFLQMGPRVVYKFGASDREHLHLRANNAVMWAAICHYAATGCTTLDLGRTSRGQEGLRRFKLGWGAEETVIGYWQYDLRRDRFARQSDRSTGWHTALFRRLPVPVLRWLGERLYPHLT